MMNLTFFLSGSRNVDSKVILAGNLTKGHTVMPQGCFQGKQLHEAK